MKAIRTSKEPHQLDVGEWCIFDGHVFACCPGDLVANLGSHAVEIRDGGVLHVSPSILVNGAPGEMWHGFIENGVWLDENKRPIAEPA